MQVTRLGWVLVLVVAVLATPVSSAQQDALYALPDRIAQEVSRLRGLPILRPLRRGVMHRNRLLARIRAMVAEQYGAEEIRHEGDVLKRLGLIPPEMDYEETMLALLREQVAGFYDYRPHIRRLYIASWIPVPLQEPTLAHEIQHALQDQHFEIGALLHRRDGESDRLAAISALCEGDAVAVMVDYMLRGTGRDFLSQPDLATRMRAQGTGTSEQPALRSAPRALRESLLFPYVAGLELVRELRLQGRRGGASYEAVDAAFRSPPESTEQVLHPERYLRRDPPLAVRLPDSSVLTPTYRTAYRDTLGELVLRLSLEERVPEQAAMAALGWGGDSVVLYSRRDARLGDRTLLESLALVSRSRWDTAQDAEEFARASTAAQVRRWPGADLTVPNGQGRRIGSGLASGVARRGSDVAWAEGVPEALLAAVLAETLSASP